jgi:predicted nucleic acid-binding protein
MILLDTNVVSEGIKPEPHPSVRDWLDAQAAETLFLSSVTVAELHRPAGGNFFGGFRLASAEVTNAAAGRYACLDIVAGLPPAMQH